MVHALTFVCISCIDSCQVANTLKGRLASSKILIGNGKWRWKWTIKIYHFLMSLDFGIYAMLYCDVYLWNGEWRWKWTVVMIGFRNLPFSSIILAYMPCCIVMFVYAQKRLKTSILLKLVKTANIKDLSRSKGEMHIKKVHIWYISSFYSMLLFN